jgi:hypothetical protein
MWATEAEGVWGYSPDRSVVIKEWEYGICVTKGNEDVDVGEGV